MKNEAAIRICARRSAVCDPRRSPVYSQTTTRPARASMRLSAPKPISAIELAARPAPIAIANSTTCQAMPPQASMRARYSSLFRSTDGRIAPSWTRPPPCSDMSHGGRQDGRHQRAPLLSECVDDHLPLAARTNEPAASQRARVMRDEVLGALDDPGEAAHAELARVEQRCGKRQTRRIRESLRPRGRDLRGAGGETPLPEPLGRRKVEAEEVAAVVGHENILMDVRVFASGLDVHACGIASYRGPRAPPNSFASRPWKCPNALLEYSSDNLNLWRPARRRWRCSMRWRRWRKQ